MAAFAKIIKSKGANLLKRRNLSAGSGFKKIGIIALIFSFSFPTNLYSQNPYLHFAFNAGSGNTDNGESVVLDQLGNIYVTGFFNGTADFDPGPGVANLTTAGAGSNAFIAKYTAAGAYLWAFNISNSTTYADGHSIFVDGAGNLYVTGSFLGTADLDPGPGVANLNSNGSTDVFVAKYSSSGSYQWAFNVGGSNPDESHSITVDGSGNVYIIGEFQNTADFDPGAGTANFTAIGLLDVFVAKYSAAGIYQWAFQIGTSFAPNGGSSITVDGSSNIYITGSFYAIADFDPGPGTANLSSTGPNDIFLAKYNSSGVYQWAFNVGGGASDVGYNVATDVSGNVYLTGYFQGFVDFNPGAGAAFITGPGAFLAKYDAAGNYLWAFPIVSPGSGTVNIGVSLSSDNSGNVFLTGRFSNTADFDPGPATANLTSSGPADIFVAKYNSSGTYKWAFRAGGIGTDVGYSIAVDGLGGIYVTGTFVGTADFDPNAGTTNLTSNGASDLFLAKYGPCPFAAGPGPITGNASVCIGSANSYSIDPVLGAISYTWTLPSGWSGSSTTTTINTIAGNSGGIISVFANDLCGPTAAQSLAITVSPTLVPGVGIFANPAGTTCPGKSVTFTAFNIGTAPASNFDFKINGATVQSGPSTTYGTTSLVDGDAITCTVTVAGACLTAPTAISNTIVASVPSSRPAVNIVASNYGPVCEGIPVQFKASPYNLGGSTVIDYAFKINGAIYQSGSADTFIPGTLFAGNDAITCTIRVIGGACITTNTATSNIIPITVDPIPVISFNPPELNMTFGSSVQLNANVSVSAANYLWTPSTGLNDPTLLNPLAAPTATTTYNLHATSANGCAADKAVTVKVYNEIYIPNSFVPNGNALNRIFKIPGGTNLRLDYLRIFDRYGNKVFSTSDINQGWDGIYKGKAATQGTYVYIIKGADFRGDVLLKGTVLLIR